MRSIKTPLVRITALLAIFGTLCSFSAEGREVLDMKGRKATIPDKIDKVFATSPPGTYLVYAIDPTKIAGLNFPLWDNEKRYTVKSFQNLPVIGGTVGMGRIINQEILLQVKPDVIVIWDWKDAAVNSQYEDAFRRMGITWVYVRLDTLAEYPSALRFMGELLGQAARGKELQEYAEKMVSRVNDTVAAIPKNERPRVFYAEGIDGLATEGATSMHAELIQIAGGQNVHQSEAATDSYGMEHVSLERVMTYDPDVILVKEKMFYDSIYRDSRWKSLKAVRNRRVHLIPYVPFNWFDRPPSFMRLLGAQWLLSVLHPGRAQVDLNSETRVFYRKFLGVELDARKIREILVQ